MARSPGSASIQVGAAQARRFLVRRQLLSPPRSLPAEEDSVLEVVRRLGSLQFDPLEVPGARNHDLVLHARVAGYRREWCERWLYHPKPGQRRLIELYNKSLNLLPIEELPYYRVIWERAAERYGRHQGELVQRDGAILHEHAEVANAIVERIRKEGPLSTAAFADLTAQIDWWWAKTRVARAVMEALFVTGRLGIARREGNRRYYDLIERVVPPRLLERSASPDEAHRHRLLSRFRGVGLMGDSAAGELVAATVTPAERKKLVAGLVDQGALVPVQVEGLRDTRYVLREELGWLKESTAPIGGEDAVTFLAPLDPLMWDRRLVRILFGFEYIWEVYTPAHKRRHGYYVLPILFGDRLVGRIEPRLDRAKGTLRILGIWFEEGFDPLEAPGFLPALQRALAAYAEFVGARKVTWPRTRLARALAARVSPVG